MAGYPQAVYQIGTVTVETSGSVLVNPLLSNSVYKNPTIVCKPVDPVTDVDYSVTVYFDGEIVERHTYPDESDRVICVMSYSDKLFPPNIGTGTIPKFYADGYKAPNPMGISMLIESTSASVVTFQVYATFEEFEISLNRSNTLT